MTSIKRLFSVVLLAIFALDLMCDAWVSPRTGSYSAYTSQQSFQHPPNNRGSGAILYARKLSPSWDIVFERLVTYKEKFGDALVDISYNDNDKPHLGIWVSNQRVEYKIFVKTEGAAGKITQERIDKLNAIGFAWSDVRQFQLDEQWMKNFKNLKEFQTKYNSTKVPLLGTDSDDPITTLGIWTKNQASEYNNFMANKATSITLEQIRHLKSIGFAWTLTNKTKHEKWLHQYFKLYLHHYKYNNTCFSDSDAYNSQFVNWVKQQKQLYHDGKLDRLKIDLLNELGFDWTIAPEPSWDDYYSQLFEYHKKYKTTLLNKRINSNLSEWCKEQRKLHKQNKLEAEKEMKLEVLDFDWDPDDEDWNAMFHRLLSHKKRRGNVLVPNNFYEDRPLGNWVTNQRRAYSKYFQGCTGVNETLMATIACEKASSRVPAEVHVARLSKLLEIGFVWDSTEAQWLQMYQKLVIFKDVHGSVLVPKAHREDPQLGLWVATQRKLKRCGKLDLRRQNLLDEIGFEWHPLESRWRDMFARLCAYKEEKGNANVPCKYAKDLELATWVESMRLSFKNQQLTPQKIEKLEAIGFIWRLHK